MDFIERLFGISPDGGNGFTELMYLAVPVFIVLGYAWRKNIRSLFTRLRGF